MQRNDPSAPATGETLDGRFSPEGTSGNPASRLPDPVEEIIQSLAEEYTSGRAWQPSAEEQAAWERLQGFFPNRISINVAAELMGIEPNQISGYILGIANRYPQGMEARKSVAELVTAQDEPSLGIGFVRAVAGAFGVSADRMLEMYKQKYGNAIPEPQQAEAALRGWLAEDWGMPDPVICVFRAGPPQSEKKK